MTPRKRPHDAPRHTQPPARVSRSADTRHTAVNASPTGSFSPEGSEKADGESRRERHRREVFERLVNTTRQLMFTRGIEEATVQNITDGADVGKGTFFNHFRTKEHVIPAFVIEHTRALERLLEVARANHAEPVLRQITEFCKNPTTQNGDWFKYYGSIMRCLVSNDDVRDVTGSRIEINRRAYEHLVTHAQERGELRRDVAAYEVARLVQRLMFGVGVIAWIQHSTARPEEVETLLQILWRGLAPTPPQRNDVPQTRRMKTALASRSPKRVRR